MRWPVALALALLLSGCLSTDPDDGTDDDGPTDGPEPEPLPPRSMEFLPVVEVGWTPTVAEPIVRTNNTHAVVINIGAVWTSSDAGATWDAVVPLSCPNYFGVPSACPPDRGTPQTNAVGLNDDELVWDGEHWYRFGLYGDGKSVPLQRASPDVSEFGPAIETLPPGDVDRQWALVDPWIVIARASDRGFYAATSLDGASWTEPDQVINDGGAPGHLVRKGNLTAFPYAPYRTAMAIAWTDDGMNWTSSEVALSDQTPVYGLEARSNGFPAMGLLDDGVVYVVSAVPEDVRVSGSSDVHRLLFAHGPSPDQMSLLEPFPGAEGTAIYPWMTDLGDAIGLTWMQGPLGLPTHTTQPWHVMYAEWDGDSWTDPIDVLGGEPAFTAGLCGSTTSGAACKLGTGGPVDFYSMDVLSDGRPIIVYAAPADGRSSTIHSVTMAPYTN